METKKRNNLSIKQKKVENQIKIFSLASFLNDFGSDMISPIWPIFLTTILNTNMTILGLIDGLGEALVSISQAFSGYLSDRLRKRKIFIFFGYLFAGISRIGYALSSTWLMIIPFKVLDRGGKIRDAPRDAIIADISNKKNRGRHFGFLETFDKLGAVFGVLVCLLLFGFIGYKNLFLIAAIPSIISVLLIYFFVKDKKNGSKSYQGFTLKNIHKNKNFLLYLIASAIFSLGAFSYSFLLVFAKQSGFTTESIPILYLIFAIFASLISIPAGRLADKIGRKRITIISFIFWILTCLNFILTQGYAMIIFSFILFGIYFGSWNTIQKTFVSELAEKNLRASYLGTYKMIMGICALPSSLIAGILWDKINMNIPFILSIILTTIALGILMFVKEKKK